eukprot:scaffold2760_cov167-Amphora_coffeaeformis.AAC.15
MSSSGKELITAVKDFRQALIDTVVGLLLLLLLSRLHSARQRNFSHRALVVDSSSSCRLPYVARREHFSRAHAGSLTIRVRLWYYGTILYRAKHHIAALSYYGTIP